MGEISMKKPYTEKWERFKVLVKGEINQNGGIYRTVTGVIALPKNYSHDGVATKLIMFAHGGHGYVDDEYWYPTNKNMEELVKSLLAEGYAVFDCNGYKDTPYKEWKEEI